MTWNVQGKCPTLVKDNHKLVRSRKSTKMHNNLNWNFTKFSGQGHNPFPRPFQWGGSPSPHTSRPLHARATPARVLRPLDSPSRIFQPGCNGNHTVIMYKMRQTKTPHHKTAISQKFVNVFASNFARLFSTVSCIYSTYAEVTETST